MSVEVLGVLILLGGGTLGLILALRTIGRRYPDSLIDRTYPDGEYYSASPARRLAGNLLDGLIFMFTLIIGWLIWLAIVAPRGQSPGKALVGTYVLRQDGSPASAGLVWVREILVKTLLFGIIDFFTFSLATIAGGLWCVWDRDKQCLWDKITTTYVGRKKPTPEQALAAARAAAGVSTSASVAGELARLKQMLDEGALTQQEYEERRRRLVELL